MSLSTATLSVVLTSINVLRESKNGVWHRVRVACRWHATPVAGPRTGGPARAHVNAGPCADRPIIAEHPLFPPSRRATRSSARSSAREHGARPPARVIAQGVNA